MRPDERWAWIERWLVDKSQGGGEERVDVLNSEFVDAYLEASEAKFTPMPYGAHKCVQLGRDLATMYKAGRLVRSIAPICGMSGMGFPAWVYSYKRRAMPPHAPELDKGSV